MQYSGLVNIGLYMSDSFGLNVRLNIHFSFHIDQFIHNLHFRCER